MATSTESNSVPRRIPRGLSSLNEFNLEKSILRRGLATRRGDRGVQGPRAKLAAKKEDAQGLARNHGRGQGADQEPVDAAAQGGRGETDKKFEIPGYQIIQKLGKGSMGIVYKARQTSVDRIVAVKILLDALAQNKEFIKRFEREAKIAAKLSHNNIVNAIDAGEVDGHHYFVMEYVEGSTIKDELDKNKIFEEKEALRIVMAVAEALKHAHAARPDPPRHQARERDPHQGRQRQARRPGPGPADGRREMGDVRGGHGDRHALLHQPRAGARPGRRRHPGRHLQPRRHALPHGHRAGSPTTERPPTR